jgi:branched-chain amino acid transport system permease protein
MDQRRSIGEAIAPLAVPVLLVTGVVLLVAMLGGSSLQRIATLGLINLVLVVGTYVFIGNSGVLSFGHLSFMAVGAYISGALTIPLVTRHVLLPDLPGPLGTELLSTAVAILVAAALAAVIALVVAVPLMRLSGLSAGIATLAVLQITFIVSKNWDAVTGGAASMPGVPRTTTLEESLLWAVGAMVIAYLFQISSTGLRLRASREDEAAARAAGTNVVRHRIVAFGLSAFIVAVGGGLYVHFLGIFSPDHFYLGATFLTLAMLVVGGMTSLFGAVVGTVVISVVAEVLRRVEQSVEVTSLTEVSLALIMLVMLILRPRGLTGGQEFSLDRFRRRLRRDRSRADAEPLGSEA